MTPDEHLQKWADTHTIQAQKEWLRYQSGPSEHKNLAQAHEKAAAALYRTKEK